MHSRIVLPFIAALALSAPAALAADTAAVPMPMAKNFKQERHDRFCQEIYPRAVGKLAYLETKLDLTASQKPLYERWMKVKLSSAKAHADQCMAMNPQRRDIMERLDVEQMMLETRLADIKAEKPSLKALVASLNDDQQKTLAREAHKARGAAHHFLGRFHDRHAGRMGHGRGFGPGMGQGNGRGMEPSPQEAPAQ